MLKIPNYGTFSHLLLNSACRVIFHDYFVFCGYFSSLSFSKYSFRNNISVKQLVSNLLAKTTKFAASRQS